MMWDDVMWLAVLLIWAWIVLSPQLSRVASVPPVLRARWNGSQRPSLRWWGGPR